MFSGKVESHVLTNEQAAASFCREWLFGESGLVEAILLGLRFEIVDLAREAREENGVALSEWDLSPRTFEDAMRGALVGLLRDLANGYEEEMGDGFSG